MVAFLRRAPGWARIAALIALPALGFPPGEALAQDGPRVSFYGFVKAETIYDTRQVLDVREGQFHLFPLADAPGTDSDNFLLTAIQSRVGVRGTGAEALGANLSGVLEGDFFGGPANANISLLILRLAYVNLAWENREVLFGQDWSLLFAPLFPGTVGFNTGAPFQPFARQPQVRFTYRPGGGVAVVGAIAGQRDAFAEIGGPRLQQQSGLPMGHLQVRYEDPSVLVGGGAFAKRVQPTATSESFDAGAVQAFLRFRRGTDFYVAGKATYGSDLTDHLMIGGFTQADDASFVPLDVLSLWLDGEVGAAPGVRLGLFGGYLRNEGASSDVVPAASPVSGLRAPNMVDLWRVAPRVVYNTGPLRFAFEVEATSALYGTGGFDERLVPQTADDSRVTNLRGLFAAYYFF